MLNIFLVFLLVLAPWFICLLFTQKAQTRARQRLRSASRLAYRSTRVLGRATPPDLQYIQGVGFVIGDISCRYNARSCELRCAVNPYGPCKDCPEYEVINN